MEIASWIMSVAAVITGLGIIMVAIRKTSAAVRKTVHMVDEILGKPAENGMPGTPGIASRLSAIEYELRPNSGKSMRDQMNRLEEWTVAHSMIHAELNHRINNSTN